MSTERYRYVLPKKTFEFARSSYMLYCIVWCCVGWISGEHEFLLFEFVYMFVRMRVVLLILVSAIKIIY